MVAEPKEERKGRGQRWTTCMCMLPLKTRPGSGIWMSLFLFSLGTSLETFMSCQLNNNIPGRTASVWICTSHFLIAISNKTSRAEVCLESREGISTCHHLLNLCSLPITCSLSVDKSFSVSVPGMVA